MPCVKVWLLSIFFPQNQKVYLLQISIEFAWKAQYNIELLLFTSDNENIIFFTLKRILKKMQISVISSTLSSAVFAIVLKSATAFRILTVDEVQPVIITSKKWN